PKPSVLVIPGGEVTATQNNEKVIKWIQQNATDADHVLSVCNGAYILAKTGLLDGQSATTFYDLIDGLVAAAPKTKVVTDKRFVDNGKTITTAGISSGIDGSLHVVSKMLGKGRAQQVALNMEYHWQPEVNYARASFADIHLRRIFTRGLRLNLPQESEARVLSTEGGAASWEVNWEIKTTAAPQTILESMNNDLATRGRWAKRTSGQAASSNRSEWSFTDDKGGSWAAVASVEPAPGDSSKLTARVRIESRKP
ncbi:MAG TPA: DJ-1/PfpI family protein, partial [Blastocatellia bacterium]|nr:DJ-1/PfpI family protein [Blastocatellia bacterium]